MISALCEQRPFAERRGLIHHPQFFALYKETPVPFQKLVLSGPPIRPRSNGSQKPRRLAAFGTRETFEGPGDQPPTGSRSPGRFFLPCARTSRTTPPGTTWGQLATPVTCSAKVVRSRRGLRRSTRDRAGKRSRLGNRNIIKPNFRGFEPPGGLIAGQIWSPRRE